MNGIEQDGDRWMDRKSAARYIGFKPGTLAVWDCTKRYDLKPRRIGRCVRYRKSELDKFLDHLQHPE
ncbi:MAG: helix-turn-helix domain-containing protein [Verrucomicrobia bacterium]|nr:helix-turn-helix domain-containing protein [Verrucomicrobiota bacterium]